LDREFCVIYIFILNDYGKSYKTKTVQLKKGKTYFDICRDYWSSDATKIVKQKEQLDSKALKHYNLKND
jgi:hypothetical protein